MAVEFVKSADFDTVTKDGIWIADFYTTNCGPCKVLDIVVNEILFDNPDVNLAKCNLDDSPEYAERFDIMGTPTLLFMNNGKITGRMVGLDTRETVEQYLSECMYGGE